MPVIFTQDQNPGRHTLVRWVTFVLCVQKLNNELQDALAEREALKTQVQQYILEVRRVEDMLASKVRLNSLYFL